MNAKTENFLCRALSWAADVVCGLMFGVLIVGFIMLTGCATPKVEPHMLDEMAHGEGGGVKMTWTTGAGHTDNYVVYPDEVVEVYDGDTFYVRVPECAAVLPAVCAKLGVRVDGVDTPERHGKCDSEREAALRARAFTDTLVRGAKTITLVDVRREKFGRLLATVVIDGTSLADQLIARGLARPYHGEARSGWCDRGLTKKAP